MKYNLDGVEYKVDIQRKNNKNIYVRIKENLTIQVSARKFTTKKEIKSLLDNNQEFLRKTISKRKKENNKKNQFLIFGEPYEIVVMPQFKNIKMVEKVIYTPDENKLDKWLKKEMKRIFEDRVRINYMRFTENIQYPEVKIRTMKTRWGVNNVTKKIITFTKTNLLQRICWT